MKNLLIAQSGGPTAAINATLAGVIEMAMVSGKVKHIYGAVNGVEGIFLENFVDLRKVIGNTQDIESLMGTPASALGSCRKKLDVDSEKNELKVIAGILKKCEIGYFVYIGGNDSMDTVHKLSTYCMENHIENIYVVGAPKTIDNDLVGTDHCPGFGSAAKYIGTTFAELERDCKVYRGKSVTIVEVMGRNAGWLTAASALARKNGGNGPDLIYLCESAFHTNRFIEDVKEKLKHSNAILIAVSEGVKDEQGNYLSEQVQNKQKDAFGHAYISGAAKVLEELVKTEIRCKVRSIELNLMQRCSSHLASATDIAESRLLGMKACQCAIDGQTGIMSIIVRKSSVPYRVEFEKISVADVANKEKKVADIYINEAKNDVNQKMIEYLLPLIQGEHTSSFANGVPKHIYLHEENNILGQAGML